VSISGRLEICEEEERSFSKDFFSLGSDLGDKERGRVERG
jgi:hypothetical protein